MSKKIGLIIAGALVVLGLFVFGGAVVASGGDFTKLGTSNFQTNVHEIREQFDSISIDTQTADIRFLPASNGQSKVVCYERESVKHSVSVAGGVLEIKAVDEREWYEYLGSFGEETLTVYLPQSEYGALKIEADTSDIEIPENFRFDSVTVINSTGDVECFASVTETLKIKTSTGDIELERMSASSMELSVSTGEVSVEDVNCAGEIKITVSTGKTELENVACGSLVSKGSTGDITLKNVIASGKFTIERSTGYVRFERSDAAEIFIKTDTGDVRGTLLTAKVFTAKTDTGRIELPRTDEGGKCEITTETGDIRLEIRK